MRGCLVILGLFVACGPLTPPQLDAGGGGSATGGGAVATGGAAGGGAGGGAPQGGGAPVGGGVVPADAFSWVNLSFSPVPATIAAQREVRGLSQDDALWVLLNNGMLYTADAGALSLRAVATFTVGTTPVEPRDLAATDAGVFILRRGDVLRCAGPCTGAADFTALRTFTGSEEGTALCSRAGRLVLVTNTSGTTRLYELNHTSLGFDELSVGLASAGGRCSINDEGDVALPVGAGVLRVFSGGGFAVEPIDAGQPASWRAVAVDVSGEGALVGGGFGVRFARRSNGAWLGLPPLTDDALMHVALPLRFGEFLVAGTYNGTGGVTVFRLDASTLAPVAPQPTVHAQRGLAVSSEEVILAGGNANDSDYVVVRGTRGGP